MDVGAPITAWDPRSSARALGAHTSKAASFVVSLVTSYLGVLGLGSFVVAAFLVHIVVGFVILGVVLLLLDKAVKREATDPQPVRR